MQKKFAHATTHAITFVWHAFRETPKRIIAVALPTALIAVLLAGNYFTFGERPGIANLGRGPSTQPDRIILTLAEDPATMINVSWRTHSKVDTAFAEIAIASESPKFGETAQRFKATTEHINAKLVRFAEFSANYHSVSFKDLQPNTLYAYRVGHDDAMSEWIHVRTANDEPEPFSFLYLGDAQNDLMSLWSRLIRASYQKVPDAKFVIHAGDLVNFPHSEREWDEWFYAGGFIHRTLPSAPLPGNHEYGPRNIIDKITRTIKLAVQWRPQFNLPQNGPQGLEETSYYFDYQGARIVVLNSNEKLADQVAWLDRVLSESTQKWNIAAFHHPFFSSYGRDNKRLRELWKPIFDKHRVDLALQGHDHTYARGRIAANFHRDGHLADHTHNHDEPYQGSAQNAVSGVNNIDEGTGTVYVVSVSGGKMYSVKHDGWTPHQAKRERVAENTQLFQVIKVADNTLMYEAYTATGELYDAFDLVKSDDPERNNQFVERMHQAGPEIRWANTKSHTPTQASKTKRMRPSFPEIGGR